MIKYICFLMFLFFHSAWSVHDGELDLLEAQRPEYRVLKIQQPPDYKVLKAQRPEYKHLYSYKHWCHLRISTTSQLISSSNPNRAQACADHGMEAGRSYPMKHACLDDDGNLLKTIDSPLSKEEACEEGRISTAAINILAGFLCEHNENPEECEEKFVTEGILPEPTTLSEFQLEKRALIESIDEQIRLNSSSE